MNDLIQKLTDPDTITLILEVIAAAFWLMGRTTKAQFMAEQAQIKGLLATDQTKKDFALDEITKPLTGLLDVANQIPIVNTKLPILNSSVPEIAKWVIQLPFGVLSEILHNAPGIGNNVQAPPPASKS